MNYLLRRKREVFLLRVLDAVGRAVFLPLRRPSGSALDPAEILLIRLDHLGDALLATGVPELMKARYPRARVTVLVAPASRPLFAGNPFVDRVLEFEAPWFDRAQSGGRPFRGWRALRRAIARGRYDLAVSLRGDLREIVAMFSAGVPRRAGFGSTGGGFLLTDEAIYRREVHESLNAAELLRTLGIRGARVAPKLYADPARAAETLKKFPGLDPAAGPVAGVQLDAGTPAKEWGAEKLSGFLEALPKKLPGYRFALIGQRAERVPPWLRGRDGRPVGPYIDLVGRTTLTELIDLLGAMTFFIGHDSGPAHIASWLGVPTLFLFSGTNEFERWEPLAPGAKVLRNKVPCSPCHLTECKMDGHPCMEGIDAAEALAALPVPPQAPEAR